MLRHCAKSNEDAAHACSELAACNGIAGCTAALQLAASRSDAFFDDALSINYAARVTEVLHGLVQCATCACTLTMMSTTASTADTGRTDGAWALARQAVQADTEAAVLALATQLQAREAAGRDSAEEDTEGTELSGPLSSLAAALRSWRCTQGGASS